MRAVLTTAFWRRSVVRVLVLVVVGAAAGGAASLLVPHAYETTSRVYVSSSSAWSVQTPQETQRFQRQVVASFANVATTPLVLHRVISGLGLRTTPAELATHVSASAAPNTTVIGITVSDASAARSARIANAISAALVAVSPSLSPSSSSTPPTRLDPIQAARASTASSGVNPIAFIGLGAAAGLLIALVITVIRSGRPKPPRGSWRATWVPRQPGEPA